MLILLLLSFATALPTEQTNSPLTINNGTNVTNGTSCKSQLGGEHCLPEVVRVQRSLHSHWKASVEDDRADSGATKHLRQMGRGNRNRPHVHKPTKPTKKGSTRRKQNFDFEININLDGDYK